MKYSEQIIKDGEKYGFKSANLMFLNDKIKNYEQQLVSDVITTIPTFLPLSHDEIIAHLDQHASNWRDQWNEFTSTFKKQSSQEIIEEKTEKVLDNLQSTIKQCFKDHPLPGEYLNKLQAIMDKDNLLMVRSTGKEDSTELANPGGNESKVGVAMDNIEISRAIGDVIASYVGKKSLSQRLKAKDDILKFPFCPVLIQEMISENMDEKVMYSGVIYSGSGSTRIQVAPGHGELIVNSKGNFDNYYITPESMVYAEIRAKHFRLTPTAKEPNKASELQSVDNNADLKYNSSLDQSTAIYLHKLAGYLEKMYGMRMDIEFVYDPSKQQVHIVQARPIPLGDRKNLKPSAIAPQFVQELTNKGGVAINGQSITPEVNRAAVITNPKEIIICNTIEEALDGYLKSDKKVKAVVIQKEAPDTSHEAGEFSSKAIPVIQIASIAKIEELSADIIKGNPLIIDAQRKKVFQIPSALISNANQDDIEASLYEKGILKEGIFKSTLTAHVTPYHYNFEDNTYTFHENICADIKSEEFGITIHKARFGSKDNIEKLFSFLYHIAYTQPHDASTISYQALLKNLDQLSNPKFSANNDESKAMLASILRLVIGLRNKEFIDTKLFNQIMISGGELYVLLEQLEEKVYDDKTLIEYLNVLEKFLGSLTSELKKDVLSESMVKALAAKKHELSVLEKVKDFNFSPTQKAYFIEVSKLGRFLINEDNRKLWSTFCIDMCKTEEGAAMLGTVVAKLVNKDLHQNWINSLFIPKFKELNGNSEATLLALLKELNKDLIANKDIEQAAKLINSLEAQIPLWREPGNFPKLYEHFKKTLALVNDKLQYDSNASALAKISLTQTANHLVDVIDKTIKSLEKSTAYDDKSLQVERFKLMLTDLYDVMKIWTAQAFDGEDRDKVISDIDKLLQIKSSSLSESELSPSGKFAVNAVLMNQPGLFPRGWGRGFRGRCQTLEDLFTLLHQNSIVAIGQLATEVNKQLKNDYPPLLKELTESLNAQFMFSSLSHPNIVLNYNVPLRDHSGRIIIEYDYTLKKMNFKFMLFGKNENARWSKTEIFSYIYLSYIPGIEIIKAPLFDKSKQMIDFEVALNNIEQIKPLCDLIDTEAKYSMNLSDPRPITPNELEILKNMSLENLQTMANYLEKLLDERNYSTANLIKSSLLSIQYCMAHKKRNLDINLFLCKNPEILLFENGYENLFPFIIGDYGEKVEANYRKDEKSFSIFEYLLQKDTNLLEHVNDIPSPNFLLLSLLINTTKEFTSKKMHKTLEKVKALVDNKDLKFNLPSADDWYKLHQLDQNSFDYLFANSHSQKLLLEIIRPKTCDLQTLNQILFVELYNIPPRTKNFSTISSPLSFIEKLVEPYGINIKSQEFHKNMMKIAEQMPLSDKKQEILNRLEAEMKDLPVERLR